MTEQSSEDLGPGCYCPPANVGDGIKPQRECPVHAYLTTEQSSEPTTEGLTEAERRALGQHFDLNYETLLHDLVLIDVERILADRLASVQTERFRVSGPAKAMLARAELAEAERDTQYRAAQDLAAELAQANQRAIECDAALDRVKALADQWDKNAAADKDVESKTLRSVVAYLRAAVEGGRS